MIRPPYETIPNASLGRVTSPAPHTTTTSEPTGKKSSVNSNSSKKELSEKSGLAILQFILTERGEIRFTSNNNVVPPSSSRSRHKETFYLGGGGGEVKKAPTTESMPLVDKVVNAATKGVCQANIKYITRNFLVTNGVTVGNLIVDCGVSMIEMCMSGVLRGRTEGDPRIGLDDLLALKFVLLDLTRNRALFDADKLHTFYGVNYEMLRKTRNFSFTMIDILACDFYASDLMALEFSLDYLISRGYANKKQIAALKFSLADLRALGLTASHVVNNLNISRRDAERLLGWDAAEYDQLTANLYDESSHSKEEGESDG